MEAKILNCWKHIKYKLTWWLSRLEFWLRHTILITHHYPWDPQGLTFCGSGGIYGDLFHLYCKLQTSYFIKYYLNLARSTKMFTEMFHKLRPKLQLIVGREINVCSNCLDFHSSLKCYSSNTWVECSNYWDLDVPTIGSWSELSSVVFWYNSCQ